MSPDRAAARASLYRLLALAFDYPHRALLEALHCGEYQEALASSALALGLAPAALPPMEGHDSGELGAAYLETFELGRDGEPACVPAEGAYVDFGRAGPGPDGEAGALMEDLLRFYHYFGLKLADDPANRLPPDHLVCQLEMLAHLSFLESRASQDDAAADGYRAAQRDFLRRHVITWLPRFAERLRQADGTRADGFYATLADAASKGVATHLEHLGSH